ncbi:MAG TPA: hypothetical protein DCP02_02940 [Actinobacteria bacterium]|nr:hypothetical protein [Actinomycetota bacterium]
MYEITYNIYKITTLRMIYHSTIQNNIVDTRFQDTDYRSDQNYVGETVAWKKERIYFVSPKPADLPGLMDGLISSHERIIEYSIDEEGHLTVHNSTDSD